jgi:hypothetical protein
VPHRRFKRESLLRRQALLERSLRDLRAGKRVDHLTEDELIMLITGLETRLVTLSEAMSAKEGDCTPA